VTCITLRSNLAHSKKLHRFTERDFINAEEKDATGYGDPTIAQKKNALTLRRTTMKGCGQEN
jgi:hypothetical protein